MNQDFFSPGHLCCPGCGQAIAAKIIINTTGKNTVVINATGCLEVSTAWYPFSAWNVPFFHSLFENAAAVASGVEAAFKYFGKDVTVIAQAGDGGTADIGLQALSGCWERGHNVLTICYDNEAYMNTGVQRSGLTPLKATTTTTPAGSIWEGNWRPKKDMISIANAHGCVYVASTTICFPQHLKRIVKKALELKGPKYLHILSPCPLGWGFSSNLTYKIARLAVDSGFFPIVEYLNGKLTSVRKIKEVIPVVEYLKLQRRFSHILKKKESIDEIQSYANANIEKYGLLAK